MSRLRSAAVVLALGLGPWGCTAIVQFVDVDAGCVGASCVDARPPDAGSDGDARVEAMAPFDASGVCRRKDGGVISSGWYCGYSTLLAQMTPSPDTLVQCDGGGATLTPCDAGCVTFPPGYPDWCNGCTNGKKGRFCGAELGAPPGEGRRYLVECSQGVMSPLGYCDAGCTASDGASACK